MSDHSAPLEPESLLQHAGWVHSLARRLVRDESTAQDIAQETLLAALEAPPREPRGIRAGLAAVTRNRVVSRQRADSRRRNRELRSSRPESEPPREDVVERAELHRALVDHVLSLREPYRTTLLLRYFEGHDPAHIAASQGTTPATVRSRLKRGLDLLREMLDEERGGRQAWLPGMIALASLPTAVPFPAPVAPSTTGSESTLLLTGAAGLGVAAAALLTVTVGTMVWLGTSATGSGSRASDPATSPLASRSRSNDDAIPGGALAGHAPGAPQTVGEPDASPVASRSAPPPESLISGTVRDELGRALSGIDIELVPMTTGRLATNDMKLILSVQVDERALGHGSHWSTDPGAQGAALGGSMQLLAPSGLLDSPAIFETLDEVVETGASRRTESDARGRFAIPGMAPGRYRLRTHGGGYRELPTEPIELRPGATVEVPLVMARGLAIEGELRAPDGSPVAGARVSAFSSWSGARGTLITVDDVHPGVEVETDALGHFRVEGLEEGPHTLVVRHPETAPHVTPRIWPGIDDLVIELEGGRALEGRVVSARGAPVADAVVTTSSEHPSLCDSVSTDAQGSFLFENLARGPVTLTVHAPGHPVTRVSRLRGQDGMPVEIVLQEGSTITGRLRDPDGNPIPGARIRTVSSVDHVTLQGSPLLSDETGAFTIDGLEVGRPLWVRIRHDDFMGTTISVDPLEVGAHDLGELELRPGGEISGRVLAASGEPITGVPIRLDSPRETTESLVLEASRRALTGVDGVFRFSRVPGGSYRVVAEVPDHAPVRSWLLEMTDGARVGDVELVAAGGAAITGLVTGEDRRAIPGARVQVRSDRDSVTTTTDAEGRFAVRGLGDEPHRVTASCGHLAPSERLDVHPGDPPVDFQLTRRGIVDGMVTDAATGAAIEEFTIRRAHDDGQGWSWSSLSNPALTLGTPFRDAEGRFRLRPRRTGSQGFRVEADGYSPESVTVEVVPGLNPFLNIRLSRGGTLTGRVVDEDGRPLAKARLQVGRSTEVSIVKRQEYVIGRGPTFSTSLTGSSPGTETGPDGRFRITGLPAGPTILTIRHANHIPRRLEVGEPMPSGLDLGDLALTRGAILHGVVKSANGRPLSGKLFIVRSATPPRPGPLSGTLWAISTTGPYRQGGLPAGNYDVFWSRSPGVVIDPSAGGEPVARITLAPGEERELDLFLQE